MHLRGTGPDTWVAWLFVAGSACFALGSVPAFVDAVGGWADGVTYAVGSVLFTAAATGQLRQARGGGHDRAWWAAATQLPGTLLFNVSTFAALVHNATVEESDRYVWRPDLYGSTLFLVSSTLGVLAARSATATTGRRSAWLNLTGSVFFMASALASYVLPSGELVSTRVSVAGTFLGAVCFLVGAALLLPAGRDAVRPEGVDRATDARTHRTTS